MVTDFIQSDSNQSWQSYQKVILLSHSDDSHTHQVLLKSLVMAGVNAAVLPQHLTRILKSYIRYNDLQMLIPTLTSLASHWLDI